MTIQEPFFIESDLFISGHDNVNIYRIPVLIVSPKGTVLAFCEAREGDDGDPTDLVLKRSLYDGPPRPPKILNGYPRTFGYGVNWERMRVVLPGNGQAIMNPCPVIDHSTGTIWLWCYEVHGGLKEHVKDPFRGRVLVTKSNDDGISWSSPVDISGCVGKFTPGPGVGVQLRDGRLVIPGYSRNETNGHVSSGIAFSDDHGHTWRPGEAVKGETNESQAVELTDGTLLLNARSDRGRGCRYVALSRDGGESWMKEFDEPALPEPGCQASILRCSLGSSGARNCILFSNPANPERVDDRTNLTVRLSDDEAKTWSVSRTVQAGPAAYSCLAVLKDGTIGLLYETGKVHPYEKISLARFNLEWLCERL